MRKRWILGLILLVIAISAQGVRLKKVLLYDRHTLNDVYVFGKIERSFQWKKIEEKIDTLLLFEQRNSEFGALNNYKNRKGGAPLTEINSRDLYKAIQDKHGVKRDQSVPLYRRNNLLVPERYGRDGAWVAIVKDSASYLLVTPASIGGQWWVPAKYVDRLGSSRFRNMIFVDRTHQNSATIEQQDSIWLIRSMNPITTGQQRPPYKRATPPGVFVVRGKLESMPFLKDGTTEMGGFAPWASRFSGGAYLHGVPVNYPDKEVLEYSSSLGTTPRSHMCVRSATSHAKFIYDWAPIGQSLVIVFD